jgi:hypothetical protein
MFFRRIGKLHEVNPETWEFFFSFSAKKLKEFILPAGTTLAQLLFQRSKSLIKKKGGADENE